MSKEFEKHNPNNSDCPITRQISIATCTCPEQKEEVVHASGCAADLDGCYDGSCLSIPVQKEEWEEELYNLAAINYNLYLSGTCERADTGEDWTFDDARWEIRDFIRTQIDLAEERGRRDAVEKATPSTKILTGLQFHRNDCPVRFVNCICNFNADEVFDEVKKMVKEEPRTPKV